MVFETIVDKETKLEYEVLCDKSGENPQKCPVCSDNRKKGNQNKKCFSYNSQLNTGHCQNCNHSFYKKGENHKAYTRPEWTNKTNLSEKVVDWFLSRNINQETLVKMKITESREYMPQVEREMNCIGFNYFRGESLVNVKFRDATKGFKMVKDAEKIFYNLNGILGQKEIYIVEGEMDCLTMVQQGYENTVSVPNGATKSNNKIDYLDNCWQPFEEATKVYILTDHDEPGEILANELARRIGVEKCYRIHLGEFKDVNEQFCKTGKIDLSDCRPFPIVGIYTVNDHWAAVEHIAKYGFPKGWKPRGVLGDHISIHPGYKTIITGIPGHGKSEFLDQMLIQLCIDYNLRGAFFTPENWPTEIHLIKLVEKCMGKSFGKMNPLEKDRARIFLHDHVVWTYPEEGYTLDSVLAKIRQAVLKHGVNWYVIDPWNKLEHQYTETETKYISESLDKISNFNQKNGTHSFIVAHPTKMKFNHERGCYEMPGLYDISGSANFYNKADIGITIHKNHEVEFQNKIAIQKVKFKYWGKIGEFTMNWNPDNGRYNEYGNDLTHWLHEERVSKLIDFSQPKIEQEDIEVPF